MIHYLEIIRRMGPFKNLSSVRYKGFHKISKTYVYRKRKIVKEKYNINISAQDTIAVLL